MNGDTSWIQRFARLGYAAKGVVYLLVGGIAVQAALEGGRATGSSGALRTLLDAPFGKALLAVMALGLLGYAFWRGYAAAVDPEHDGAGKRAYYGVTALLHLGLAFEAARLALGQGGGGGGATQHWSARLLAQPFGALLLGGVGAVIASVGIGQLVHAWKAKLDEQLDLAQLDAGTRRWVVRVARAGIAARGVVFLLIGGFAIRAALAFDPGRTEDVGGALQSLQRQPYGSVLLGAVAVGLIAYGVYELIRARYRVIRAEHGHGLPGSQIKLERI